MTLNQLKKHFYSQLEGRYPTEEIQSFFSILSEHFLNYSRIDTVLKAEERVLDEQLRYFEDALLRLVRHEPVQYITGGTEFYGLPFFVNASTLIPRPETEELVEWIIEDHCETSLASPCVLDIGTGSGVIAISIAKYLQKAKVDAIDISVNAIAVARENACRNEVDVLFSEVDVLQARQLSKKYDIIVSNPPYVRELEKVKMKQNVLAYEPDDALFVSDQDPLMFYRKIGELAKTHLTDGGSLYFEINEYLSTEMKKLLEELEFSEIKIKKDIFGKDRMMHCVCYG